MTLNHFAALGVSEQLRLTRENGQMIGRHRSAAGKVQLYQVEGFYVELHFCAATGELKTIRSSSSVNMLHHYLKKIDISFLLKNFLLLPMGELMDMLLLDLSNLPVLGLAIV